MHTLSSSLAMSHVEMDEVLSIGKTEALIGYDDEYI
jgi:hypothetical protein